MKKLTEYKLKNTLSDKDLAQLINVSIHYVRKLRHEERRPSPELAARISAATNGEITIQDLLYPSGLPNTAKLGQQNNPT
jgi:transcriptional regulator with XRE-family HTH domain